MTIPVQVPRNSYTADGINDTFAFTFRILQNSDLTVEVAGILQTEGVDYTVQNPTATGGDVVFEALSIPALGDAVNLDRGTELDQTTSYTPFDPFPAKTHELALDKLTMVVQELNEAVVDADVGDFTKATVKETITAEWNFNAPPILSGSLWPADLGTDNYVLKTNGAGILAWVAQQGGPNWDPLLDWTTSGNWTNAGNWIFDGQVFLVGPTAIFSNVTYESDISVRGKDTGGNAFNIAKVNLSNVIEIGHAAIGIEIKGISYDFSGGNATFANTVNLSLGALLNNTIPLQGKEVGGAARNLAYITGGNVAEFGSQSIDAVLQALATAGINIGTDQVATFVAAVNGSLLIKDIGGNVRKTAFRNPGSRIYNTPGGSDIVLQSDEGQVIDFDVITSTGTLNLAVLEKNTHVDVRNGGDIPMLLVENGTTLNWIKGDSSGSITGDRTISTNSIVHLRWRETNVIEVWGNGIS